MTSASAAPPTYLVALLLLLLPSATRSVSWWPTSTTTHQDLHGATTATTLPLATSDNGSSAALVQSAVGLSEVQVRQLGLDAKPTTVWPPGMLKQRQQSALPLEPWASDPEAKPMSVSGSEQWQGFDLELSKVFARLTSAAYCSNAAVIQHWTCTRCRLTPKFQVHTVVYDKPWSLLAYVGYHPKLNGIVAVFRGTDSHHWANWIENLRYWQQSQMWPLPGGSPATAARVHAGFYNMWSRSSLQSNIAVAIEQLRELHPGAKLYVTGHSMGAALAQLCALDARLKFDFAEVHAYTFGSPRVGNAAFQQLFEDQVNSSWRFTHGRDVVPSLPPTLVGYHHVAREVWTVDIASPIPEIPPQLQLLMCDTSGEDPTCHNSACLLGLCTSVTDHLHYLQYKMYHSVLEC